MLCFHTLHVSYIRDVSSNVVLLLWRQIAIQVIFLKIVAMMEISIRECVSVRCSDFDPCCDPVADCCCSLSEDIEEDMLTQSIDWRHIVPTLLTVTEHWLPVYLNIMYHVSKSHWIKHCTSLDHQQYTLQVWNWKDVQFLRYVLQIQTDVCGIISSCSCSLPFLVANMASN